MEGCALESRIWGKSQLSAKIIATDAAVLLPPWQHAPTTCRLWVGGNCTCFPSGHGLDTVGLDEQWQMCFVGYLFWSLTDWRRGHACLQCRFVAKGDRKMVGKWDAPSRLTLFTQLWPCNDLAVLHVSAGQHCSCDASSGILPVPNTVLAILPLGTEFGSFTRGDQMIPWKTPSQGTL